MASSKPQASCSAVSSPEELSVVQVMDSSEPLVANSSSVPLSVQVLDFSEPLVPLASQAQVLDSNEPLGLASNRPSVEAGPSGVASVPSPNALLSVAGDSDVEGDSDGDSVDVGAGGDDAGANAPRLTGSSGRRIHYYSEELRTHWNHKKVESRLGTHEQCVAFAEERGLIPRQKMCAHHRRPMTLSAVGGGQLGVYRCRKSNCRARAVSRAAGTWFENVHIALKLVFQIMYWWSQGLTYEQVRKETYEEDGETLLSHRTIPDWFSYCRETVIVYELEHQDYDAKIGGPNKVVQIDESKFGKRKYNRGRRVEGHWVIGMIEDGSDDLRLEVCSDNLRISEVLVPLIQKHVEEGSIIHTDFWRAYDCLPEHGYIHHKVNHSDPENRFVAPDGTHTQRIESHWRGLKKAFQKDQYKGNFADWLVEHSWRRKIRINHLDAFEQLLKAVEYVYRVN